MNQNRNNPIAGMLGQLLRQNPQMQSNPLAQNMISVIQNDRTEPLRELRRDPGRGLRKGDAVFPETLN